MKWAAAVDSGDTGHYEGHDTASPSRQSVTAHADNSHEHVTL